jgi:hypothetical protein
MMVYPAVERPPPQGGKFLAPGDIGHAANNPGRANSGHFGARE